MKFSPTRFDFLAVISAALLLAARASAAGSVEFPGPPPGEARARVDSKGLVLENQVLSCQWSLADGKLRPLCFVDKLAGVRLPPRVFAVFVSKLIFCASWTTPKPN